MKGSKTSRGSKLLLRSTVFRISSILFLLFLTACASTPEVVEQPVAEKTTAWSIDRVVQSDTGMISLLDPYDLAHHEAEPANWFMYDFAVKDDLQTGRFAAVLTERPGRYRVRLTTGELTPDEKAVAGPEAILRLRVINRRLLLSGGDTWPSVETSHKNFAYDQRWIGMPNGDYGVIITALDPFTSQHDYVFQLIKVEQMTEVNHAPALPQLIYGEQAGIVGVNARGSHYSERCGDVPGQAVWIPLVSRNMPMPGAVQNIELPSSVHSAGLARKQSGANAAMPAVLARNPVAGSYGFYIKPDNWSEDQLRGNAGASVRTLVRCAVKIIEVVAAPTSFQLKIQALPTARDRISPVEKTQLINGFRNWMTNTNDMAWHFKTEMIKRSEGDSAMVKGILEYLNLSSKESELLLPMSNALRAEYLLDRLREFNGEIPE